MTAPVSPDISGTPGTPGTPSDSASTPSLVLFDLDDTLLAHRNAVDHGITVHRATLSTRNLAPGFAPDDATEVARWHALEEKHYHRYLSDEIDFLGQRRARARDFVAPYGLELSPSEAEHWYNEYSVEYQNAWALHDDALPCLDELRRVIPSVRIGLITNGELAHQTPKVDTVGLWSRIEHLIASGELGVTKPDARIFHHACDLFGVDPTSAVYIGDRLYTDAIGAVDAGLAGVWLDRPGTATDEDLAAAAASGVSVIRTLDELSSALLTHFTP